MNRLRAVLNTMEQYHASQSDFVITAGDNFYENDIHTVTHPRWHYGFEQLFNGSAFMQLPFFVVAGNHDWRLDGVLNPLS